MLIPGLCRAICGDSFISVWRIFRKLPQNSQRTSSANFSRKCFTYIHAQNRQHSSPIPPFWTLFLVFVRAHFLLAGGQVLHSLSKGCGEAATRRQPLSFLSLFFWKKAGKNTKKQGFFIPAEPLKSPKKKGKTLKKKKEFLARGKSKEFQENKERKDRDCPRAKYIVEKSCCHCTQAPKTFGQALEAWEKTTSKTPIPSGPVLRESPRDYLLENVPVNPCHLKKGGAS